ncbi:MAG: succinate dehydrogenase cytochrome b subunit [Acidobacteria bacterium]|nr:succinate dehydrogenase cytochrome b subunit [Acidobacteriota bacterium]
MGKKVLMAVTGLMLFGFVLGHMIGNLKLYLGPESINHYAEWLRDVGSPLLPHGGLLWIARVGILAAVGVHILAAWQLTMINRRARPIDYAGRRVVRATYASRTMRWGGVLILLFVIYHLAHFTWGFTWAHPDFVAGDVYHNVVAGFRVWPISAFYIVAQAALALHLYHGLWSLFQSLGWSQANLNPWRRTFAKVFATLIFIGNVSFPISVLVGLVGER